MNELKLADLGEGMHEAEIVEWLVQEGENVKLDQPVVRVETDKAIVEIPSPVAGQVSKIHFQPGQTARVGEVLVAYASNGQRNLSNNTQQEATTSPQTTQEPVTWQPGSDKKRVLASPAVRKQAFALHVDLADVKSSTVNGRVTMDDLQKHLERSETAPGETKPAAQAGKSSLPATPQPIQINREDERQPLTGLRKRMAEHMERSWRTIPHATAFDELDASELVALRQALLPITEKNGVRLTYMPLLVKLLLPALKAFPIFNASLDEEKREIIYHHAYHLGVATASPEGLLVPVLRDADKLSVLEIARQLERLIEGAKQRTLALHELSGSTFTLNNVGSFGGSSGAPIINHPEVAILAVGKIEERAIVRNGTILAQPRMPLALSFDHRLIDGAMAGAFLARFKELVERPQQLLLEMI